MGRIQLLVDASNLAFLVVLDGIPAFREALEQAKRASLMAECEAAIEFLVGRFGPSFTLARCPSEAAFTDYVRETLDLFLCHFLEKRPTLSRYRACIFRLDPVVRHHRLLYFVGVAPTTNPFSEEPLPIDNSLAGAALRNLWQPQQWNQGEKNTVPFIPRAGTRPYQSVIVCAGKPLDGSIHDPIGPFIVCIDGVDNARQLGPFLSRMVQALTILVASAQGTLPLADPPILGTGAAKESAPV